MRRRGRFVAMLMTAFLTLAVGLAVAATGCGESAESEGGPLTLTYADNGDGFTLTTGDTIVVVLQGNPTTGYSWIAALDEQSAAILQQGGEPVYTEDATDESVVGSGGTFTFTFTAAEKGDATLKLIYARSWEDEAPEQTFEATVTVE